ALPLLGGLAGGPTLGRRFLRPVLHLALPVLGAPHLLQVTTSHVRKSLSVVVLVAALRQLLAARLRGVDRVQEGRPHTRLFQAANGLDRPSTRLSHHLAGV